MPDLHTGTGTCQLNRPHGPFASSIERTFAWLLHNRRLTVAYERTVQISETLIVRLGCQT